MCSSRSAATFSCLCLVFLVCLGGRGQAQVLTSVSTTAPNNNAGISAMGTTLTLTNSLQWRWQTTDQRDVGQTFTPSTAFTLDSVSLEIAGTAGAGTPGTPFTFSLDTFANNASGTPASTVATFTGTLPASGLVADTYLTFDIPNTALTANTTYGFLLSFNSAKAGQAINFYNAVGGSNAAYPGGTIFFGTPAAGYTVQPSDFQFVVTAVPEPVSLPILLLALAVGIFLRWRKSAVAHPR